MPIVYVCCTRHHVLAASGCSTGRHKHTLIIDTLFLQAFHHFSISICWHFPPSSPWSNWYCCSHMLTAHPQHKLVLQCFAVVWILEKMINTYWKNKEQLEHYVNSNPFPPLSSLLSRHYASLVSRELPTLQRRWRWSFCLVWGRQPCADVDLIRVCVCMFPAARQGKIYLKHLETSWNFT